MANYTMTMVLKNASLMMSYGLTLNDGILIPSNTTVEVGAGSTLACAPDYGSVYLNGANLGRSHTHTINSNITVTCAQDGNVYIVTEESSGGGTGGGHKALINGNAYSISGGKAMVGGTVYDISGGKTMVGGTVREIAFAGGTAIVTITGSGYTLATLKINGTTYRQAATLELPVGTVIECNIKGTSTFLELNGSVVATASGNTTTTYEYIVKGNVAIALNGGVGPYIKITEE